MDPYSDHQYPYSDFQCPYSDSQIDQHPLRVEDGVALQCRSVNLGPLFGSSVPVFGFSVPVLFGFTDRSASAPRRGRGRTALPLSNVSHRVPRNSLLLGLSVPRFSRASVPFFGLSSTLIRMILDPYPVGLSVPVVGLSVPLFGLSVPLFGLSVPLARQTAQHGAACNHGQGGGRRRLRRGALFTSAAGITSQRRARDHRSVRACMPFGL